MTEKEQQGIICVGCLNEPSQLSECQMEAEAENMTPDEWVTLRDGTYNKEHQTFYCTRCYIKAGMPLGKAPKLKIN